MSDVFVLLSYRLLLLLEEHVHEAVDLTVLCSRLSCSLSALSEACALLHGAGAPLLYSDTHCILTAPCEPWSQERLVAYFDHALSDFVIHRRFLVTSTNDWALLSLRRHLLDPKPLHLFLCEYQTQGRGRYGRHWHAGLGRSICVSYVWHATESFSLSSLTVMLAYTVMLALRGLGYCGVQVKWPNDLMLSGQKCGGILVEKHGHCYIIGIGLNCVSQQTFVGLNAAYGPYPPSRHALLVRLSLALRDGLAHFLRCGFVYAAAHWQADQYWYQQWVRFSFPGGACIGRVVGIDQAGCLLMQEEHGRVSAYGIGEVKGCLIEAPFCC